MLGGTGGQFVVGSAWVNLKLNTDGLNKSLGGASRDVDAAGKKAGSTFGNAFKGATAGILAGLSISKIAGEAVQFVGDAIGEAREAQKVGAQTDAVLKSTGGTVGRTREEIEKYASALSAKIGVDDEAIQSNANLLLTFTNIRGEMFDRAIPAVQDLATAFKMDGKSAAIMLGKALNDPIKGVTALGRAGVQFTAEQKAQIKTMAANGDLLGAQTLIMKELEMQTKGSAEAQATAADKAKVAFANLKESVGTMLLPVLDKLAQVASNVILPAFEALFDGLRGQQVEGAFAGFAKAGEILRGLGSAVSAVINWFREHEGVTRVLAATVGGLVAVYGAYRLVMLAVHGVQALVAAGTIAWHAILGAVRAATIAWTAVQWALNAALSANPIGIIILAVAALVAGIIFAYKHFEGFRNIVDTAFRAAGQIAGWLFDQFARLWDWFRDVAWPLATAFFQAVWSGMQQAWNIIQPILSMWWNTMQAVWGWIANVAWVVISNFFQAVWQGMQTVWNIIQPILSTWWAAMQALWSWLSGTALPVARSFFEALWTGMQRAWGIIQPLIATWWQGMQIVWDWLRNTAWPFIQSFWQGLQDKIAAVVGFVVERFNHFKQGIEVLWMAVQVAVDRIRDKWQEFQDKIAAVGDFIQARWETWKSNVDFLRSKVHEVVEAVKAKWQEFQDKIAAVGDFIQARWETWKANVQFLREKVNEVVEGIKAKWDEFQGKIAAVGDAIQARWESWKANMQGLRDKANEIVEGLKAKWQEVQDKIGGVVDGVKAKWEDFKAANQLLADKIREHIEFFKQKWQEFQDKINTAVDAIKAKWEDFKAANQFLRDKINEHIEFFKLKWQEFQDKINAVVDAIKMKWEDFKASFQFLRDKLNEHVEFFKLKWHEFQDKIHAVVDSIKAKWEDFKGAMQGLRADLEDKINLIGNKFDEMKNRILAIWDGLKQGIAGKWGEIKNLAGLAINKLAWAINQMIGVFNKIPFVKIDLIKEPIVPDTLAEGGAIGRARGGSISGGPPGVDTVPAIGPGGRPYMLDNGEHVFTRLEVRKMGGQSAVYRLRNWVRSASPNEVRSIGSLPATGMAGGGRVGGENEGLLQGHRDHVHVAMDGPPMSFPQIIAHAARSRIPYNVVSTFRPGSRGSGGGLDHHSTGRAVDFGGFEQDALAGFFERLPGVIELIHRTGQRDYAIFGGGGGGGGLFSWLMSAAGQLVKKLFGEAVSRLEGVFPQGDGLMPTAIRGMGKHVLEAAKKHFEEMINSAGGGPGGPVSGNLREWINKAKEYVSIEDEGKLSTLIMRESGGNPNAINNWDSNAKAGTPSKGLMQTIDPTFQRYRDPRLPNNPFDPVANIVAGMNYIHARYGSLHNVQQANAGAAPRGYAEGGAIGMRNGGVVPGIGTGDRIPIMAEPGEVMISNAQQRSGALGMTIQNMSVTISAKDIQEMKDVSDFFKKIDQVARAGVR